MTKARAHWLMSGLLVLILLLSLSLRLYLIDAEGLWWDDAWGVWLSKQDLTSIALTTRRDEHPPLYYWFLHFWTAWAGDGEFALRLPSAFFGVLTVALLYSFGRRMSGRGVGLLAAFLLALARFHVWWSQEVKMYALALFLALLSLYLFYRLLWGGSGKLWLPYILVNSALLYTVYLGALVLLVEGIALVLLEAWLRRWRLLLWWGLALAAIFLLYLPWLQTYLANARVWSRQEPFETTLFLRLYASVLPLGISTDLHRYTGYGLLLWLLAAVGLLQAQKAGKVALLLILLSLLLPPLGVYLLSLPEGMPYHPKVTARYLILFLPFFSLLASQGVVYLWSRRRVLGVALFIVFTATFAYTLGLYFGERPASYLYWAMGRYLAAHALPGDALVLNPDKEWPLLRYYIRAGIPWYELPDSLVMTGQETELRLRTLPDRHARVWLLSGPEAARTDPNAEVQGWLKARFQEVASLPFERTRLTLFAGKGVGDGASQAGSGIGAEHPRRIDLGDALFLGFDRIPDRVRVGNTVPILTYWQGLAGKEIGKLHLVLEDERGNLALARPVVQPSLDHPPRGVQQLMHVLPISALLPSGSYRLEVRWGDPALGAAKRIVLKRITVEVRGTPLAEGAPTYPYSARLGRSLMLKGYSLSSTSPRRSDTLRLTLYWEALEEMEASYTVFVHLLAGDKPGGRLLTQRDNIPVQGAYPTSAWAKGELVIDSYELLIGPELPLGRALIDVGVYDAALSQRLPVFDGEGRDTGENHIPLAWVEILDQAPHRP